MKKMKAIFSLLLVLCCMMQFAAPMAMADGGEDVSSPLSVEVWGWDSANGKYAKPVDNPETEDKDESKKFEGEYALDPMPATVEDLNANGTVISVGDVAYYVNSIILKSEGAEDVYVSAKFAGGDGAYYKDLYIKPGTVSAANPGASYKLVLCVSEEASSISLNAGEVSGIEFSGASGVSSFTLPSLSDAQAQTAAAAGKEFDYWAVSYPNGMSLGVGAGGLVPVFGATVATAQWTNTIATLDEPGPSKVAVSLKPKSPIFYNDKNGYEENIVAVSSGELSEGHKLNQAAFNQELVYSEDGTKISVKLSIKEGAAPILGVDDADVSGIYDITLENRGFTLPVLTITAKAPKLNSDGDEYVTDGYTNTDLDTNELMNDEGIVLAVEYSEDESKVKATAKAAEGKAIVKNIEGSDISNKYYIVFADSAEIANAAQEVDKTSISIKAKDPKFDDAKGEYVEDGFEAVTGLAEGHKINEDNLGVDLAFSTDGKAIEVRITCDENKPYIVDADGNDVTKFYNVSVAGPAEFVLPVLTITAKAAKLNDDGNAYVADGLTYTGLEEGDTLMESAVDLRVVVNSDKTKVSVTPFRKAGNSGLNLIVNGDKKNIDKKYYVEYKASEIDYDLEDKGEIDVVKITIKAKDRKDVTYTGEPIKAKSYTISSGELKAGHKIDSIEYSDGPTTVDEGKDEDANKSMPSNAVIKDENGTDVTAEYEITYKPGTITIKPTKKNITITANSHEWEYDGAAHRDWGVTIEDDELCQGDTVKARAVGDITEPGTVVNRVVVGGDQKWRIISADNKDVTNCYDKSAIELVDGELKVTPKKITIKGVEKEVEYDGSSYAISNAYIEYDTDDLVEGHRPYIEAQFAQDGKAVTPKKAGYYDIELKKVIIKDADKKDVTKFYEITTEDGYLLIKPEGSTVVTITAPDYEWTYDSKNHSYHGSIENYEIEGLMDGDQVESVTFSDSSVIKNAGTVANVIISAKIVDADGKAVDSNKYAIKFVPGTLTVNKYDITITAESDSKKYDGTALVNKNVTVTKLANENHKIAIDYSVIDKDGNVSTAKYPGTYTKKITSVKITEGNTDVTSNYNIKIVNGTLTITGTTNDPVKTGDESNIGLLIGVMAVCVAAMAAVVVIIIKKNKKKPEDDSQL